MSRVLIHVESGPCTEQPGCDWSGFHLHWRGQRYRTAFPELGSPAVPPELSDAFDADCAADSRERRARW